jgi:hypothetical protein
MDERRLGLLNMFKMFRAFVTRSPKNGEVFPWNVGQKRVN